jgi:DNA polymerase alpha subunit A
LDLDGIFKSMLLLKKKKYAAVVIQENADGTITYEKEMKGLDLVRRDWCGVSKQAGQVCMYIYASMHLYVF